MTLVTEFRAFSVTKVGKKKGRPTLRKNSIPLAPREKQKRYRDRLRRERARSYCEWYTPSRYIGLRAEFSALDELTKSAGQ